MSKLNIGQFVLTMIILYIASPNFALLEKKEQVKCMKALDHIISQHPLTLRKVSSGLKATCLQIEEILPRLKLLIDTIERSDK